MQSKTMSLPHAPSPRSHRVQRELAAARLALRRTQRCSGLALDVALDRLIADACRPTPSLIRRTLRRLPVIRVLARSTGERQAARV